MAMAHGRDGPFIAEAAALIGDPARANMLGALMDGRARTASELAYLAGVAASTASGHLGRMLQAGLIGVAVQGRHRYYRIDDPAVARALESLMLVATAAARGRPRAGGGDAALRRLRSCYDHLAGQLAVALAEGLVRRGLLARTADAFSVTAAGERWFAELGIDVAALRRSQRPLARCCLDWSERRDHIAGSLGAALMQRLLDKGHVARQRDGRALTVNPSGERFFAIACGDGLAAVA